MLSVAEMNCTSIIFATILLCLAGSGTVAVGAEESQPSDVPPAIEHSERDIEGWTVHVDRRLLDGEHAVLGEQGLRILGNKLYEIALVMPPEHLARLREVPIFVDLDHPLKNLQYHPSAGWLREHGHDPAMARAVHVPQVQRLVDLVRDYAQPAVLLHELAHAYHDRVLGFDYGPIREAYDQAVAGGQYDSVLRIGGARQRHYALTNHKEFFAEMTECYFGTNDFYPFLRAELADCDPRTCALLETIWREPAEPSGP